MGLNLKAVLFDLGGTLIKTASPPKVFKRILTSHGIKRSVQEISAAYKEAEQKQRAEHYLLPYDEFWMLFNVEILRKLKIKENLNKLADIVTNEWWDKADLELYPNVMKTLCMLKDKGLKIGLVTNGYQKDIDEILMRTGLIGLFDVTVGADAVKKPKPAKEIFLYAIDKLGVLPQEVLFVGDNPKTDYEGAKNAGLKPLLIDQNCTTNEGFVKIRDLEEIVKYL